MYEQICGAWFAIGTWAWGWKLLAFLVTWTALGFLVGWSSGRASMTGDGE